MEITAMFITEAAVYFPVRFSPFLHEDRTLDDICLLTGKLFVVICKHIDHGGGGG